MGLLERYGGWQRCQEYLDVEWMGGRGLIQVDHIDDATFAAVEIGCLLVRGGRPASGAGCLGRLMRGEVMFIGSTYQNMFMGDDETTGSIGKEWDRKLDRKGCQDSAGHNQRLRVDRSPCPENRYPFLSQIAPQAHERSEISSW